MRSIRRPRLDATILGAVALFVLAFGGGGQAAEPDTQRFVTEAPPAAEAEKDRAASVAGIWISDDDAVRLDVAENGTYERTVLGQRKSARGTYRVSGTSLLLRDESGVQVTVTREKDRLVMLGHRLAKI